MQITLRKAAFYREQCALAAARIEVHGNVKVSVHTLPQLSPAINTYLNTLEMQNRQNLDDILSLTTVKYDIRRMIDEANTGKIKLLLGERASLEDREKRLSTLLASTKMSEPRTYLDTNIVRVSHDTDQLMLAMTGVRSRLSSNSDGVDMLLVSCLSEATIKDIEQQIATIRRRRADLNDELMKENLSRTITLPDNIIAVLRKHSILPPAG